MQVGKVYAKISIGILGFIVWSQVMALLNSDIKISNFAICWNSYKLLGTFNSKNPNRNTQSAGNQIKLSSSETTRKKSFNFDLANQFLDIHPDWLTWFIGFTEGDGAIQTYKNSPRFVITQKERAVLDKIQATLKFGKVVEAPHNIHRYIVTDIESIKKLTYIFNDNQVQTNRIKQLSLWVGLLNNKGLNLKYQDTPVVPSLNDGWLSGFTDAEGCFNVNILNRQEEGKKNSRRVVLRYIQDQKNALSFFESIKCIFSHGFVTLRSHSKLYYRFTISNKEGLLHVKRYLDNFPLKTKKLETYNLWLEVLTILNYNRGLNESQLSLVMSIKKKINLQNSLNKKTGSSLKD